VELGQKPIRVEHRKGRDLEEKGKAKRQKPPHRERRRSRPASRQHRGTRGGIKMRRVRKEKGSYKPERGSKLSVESGGGQENGKSSEELGSEA